MTRPYDIGPPPVPPTAGDPWWYHMPAERSAAITTRHPAPDAHSGARLHENAGTGIGGLSDAIPLQTHVQGQGAILRLVLAGERPRSLNQVYRRVHWSELTNYTRACGDAVAYALAQADRPVLTPPVVLTVTAYGPRPMDADNLAIKPYVDALRRQGVLPDDTPAVVAMVRLRSVRAPRKEQQLVIEIEEVA